LETKTISFEINISIYLGDLIWCCGIMKAYPDFFPLETWGSLLGDKNRYIRREWDEKHCNDLVGSSKGENCKGREIIYELIPTFPAS
jgi:hypothetical protein